MASNNSLGVSLRYRKTDQRESLTIAAAKKAALNAEKQIAAVLYDAEADMDDDKMIFPEHLSELDDFMNDADDTGEVWDDEEVEDEQIDDQDIDDEDDQVTFHSDENQLPTERKALAITETIRSSSSQVFYKLFHKGYYYTIERPIAKELKSGKKNLLTSQITWRCEKSGTPGRDSGVGRCKGRCKTIGIEWGPVKIVKGHSHQPPNKKCVPSITEHAKMLKLKKILTAPPCQLVTNLCPNVNSALELPKQIAVTQQILPNTETRKGKSEMRFGLILVA
jgi:hypothetical protein